MSPWFRYLEQIVLWGTLVVLTWNWRHTFHFAQLGGSYYEYGSWHIYAGEAGVILLLLFNTIRGWSIRVREWWPLGLLLGWSLLSATWSVNPVVSLATGLHLLIAIGLLLYVIQLNPLAVVRPLVMGLSIQAVVGVGQFVRNASLGLGFIGESPLNVQQSGIGVIVHDGARQLRAYGLAQHPNIFGGLLVAGLPLVSSWLMPLGIFLAVGITLSFSRNAWLAGILVIGLLLWFGGRQVRRWLGVSLVVVVVLMSFYTDALTSRLTATGGLETRSVAERMDGVGSWISLWSAHKWLGVGAGAYVEQLVGATPGLPVWDYRPVHNIFLLILGELGIVGFLVFLIVVVMAYRESRKLIQKPGGWIWILPWWSLLLMGLFDHWVWSTVQGELFLFLALALLFSANRVLLESYGIRGIRNRRG